MIPWKAENWHNRHPVEATEGDDEPEWLVDDLLNLF